MSDYRDFVLLGFVAICLIFVLTAFLFVLYFKVKNREKELKYQSRHDPITLLPNSISFSEQLQQRIQKHPKLPFALVAITIDRFPQINHTLGRNIGERLLHHIGSRLTSNVAQIESLSRLSNHLFVGILNGVTPENHTQHAKAILEQFETPFSVYTVAIDVDALLGFSFYPTDSLDAPTLLQKADVALYASRTSNDRFECYHVDKDPSQAAKLSLMSELREGLLQDEFAIYYQPKVELSTNTLVQVEALVRWNHPTKGFISADQFIPLAEETGHIKKLTAWLLDKAFAQCQQWQQSGINLGICVNLSVKDLLNKDLLGLVSGLLNTYAIDPTRITLEITESALMLDPDKSMQTVHDLSNLGLRFSIDDFGTGYSSLSYLRQIPIDELKIDQTFIKDITLQPRVGQLVRSIIGLGHSLTMVVVAEGIEDQLTYDTLKDFGCDLGQGYLFSEPIAAADFMNWAQQSPWFSKD